MVRNSFIDESFMSPHGEPIEYTPSFGRNTPGIVVEKATEDEWNEAVKLSVPIPPKAEELK